MKRWLMAGALALAAQGATAAEVAGVKIADTVKVGNADLVLNGAGLRQRFVVKVYVAALYLPEKKAGGAEAMAAPGAKRIALHIMRDLTSEQFAGALNEGLNANLSDAEREKFKTQIEDLKTTMDAVGAAKEKSVVTLDLVPGAGMRVSLDGAQKGKTIAGDDFYRAFMKIWLGEKPADRGLRSALLGQAQSN